MSHRAQTGCAGPVLVAVWATFLFWSVVAVPIPGVNEPHYLCKARHFWEPGWCPNDFFLASPNAHTVFYATIGVLTRFLSFEQSAFLGRALGTLILAWGWTHCLSALLFNRWAVLWCAWVFLAISACGNFSGEWLVGGIEGKVFSYGFLFVAIGDVLRQRWLRSAIWCGLAISFHPIVGIWGMMALVAVRLTKWIHHLRSTSARRHFKEQDQRNALIECLKWASIAAILAMPGMIPVVQLLTEKISPEIRYEANYIQVFFRLAHHLDPMAFPLRAYLGYLGLLAFWICGFAWTGRTNTRRVFDQFVLWSVVFAIGGIIVGFGPRPANLMSFFELRMNLLKFYPFRLADVMIPIAVSVSLIAVLERTCLYIAATEARWSHIAIPHLLVFVLFLDGLVYSSMSPNLNRYAREDRSDWLDVCRWVDRKLPKNVVIQSPTNGWAFKWFAKRAEFVAFKDCPQDAKGIVEWNRRLNFLNKWYEEKYVDQLYSAGELKELRRETGITHLLTDRLGPLELEPVYYNMTFQVYDLTTLD